MKKILASLLVLALCAPAMAATITVAGGTDGTAVVTIAAEAGEANLVGLGLDVDVDNGAKVVDVSVDTANFNIFPDAAYTQELGGDYVYGTGSPACAKTVAGSIDLTTNPQSSFALSFANLNGAAVAGADGAATVQVTLTVDKDCTLTVCENATRGGIVAVDGAALDAACDDDPVTVPGAECVKSTASFYNDWVAFGSPDCWCFKKHCRGDADGADQGNKSGSWAVGTDDLDIFLPAWLVKEQPAGPGIASIPNGICADFAKDEQSNKSGKWRVGTNDLDLFLANWLVKNPGVADCDSADFNFWTN